MFMRELNAWFRQNKFQKRWYVNLSDALFSNRQIPYVLYRLRYFVLIQFMEAVIFFVEYLFVAHFMNKKLLFSYLAFRIATLFFAGAWWGLLEILRTKIRHIYSTEASPRVMKYIQAQITAWFYFSGLISVFILFLAGAYFMFFRHLYGASKIFDWYVIFAAYQLICYLLVRSLYSGVYAIVRIWRPLWVSLLPSLGGLILIALLWGWLGVYSFPIAMLISSSLMSLFLMRYVFLAYKKKGVVPLKYLSFSEWKKIIFSSCSSESLLCFLCGGVIQLQFLLLLLIISVIWPAHSSLSLAALFYILFPQFDAAFNWSRLTYFDGKRLLKKTHGLFLKRVSFTFLWIGLMISFSFWLLASFFVVGLSSIHSFFVMLDMFPLFMLTAWLVFLQMQLFVKKRYFNILLSGFVIGLAAWWNMAHFVPMSFDVSATLFVLVAVMLCFLPLKKTSNIAVLKVPLGFFEWARCVQQSKSPGIIISLQLVVTTSIHQASCLADMLCEKIGEGGNAELTFLAPRYIFIKLKSDSGTLKDSEKMFLSTLHAKHVRNMLVYHADCGIELFRKFVLKHPLFRQFGQLNFANWRQRFSTTFNDISIIHYPDLKQSGKKLKSRDVRGGIYAVERYLAQPLSFKPYSTCLCELHQSNLSNIMFIPNRRYSKRTLLKWQKYIFVQNIYDLMSADDKYNASFFNLLDTPKTWLKIRFLKTGAH